MTTPEERLEELTEKYNELLSKHVDLMSAYVQLSDMHPDDGIAPISDIPKAQEMPPDANLFDQGHFVVLFRVRSLRFMDDKERIKLLNEISSFLTKNFSKVITTDRGEHILLSDLYTGSISPGVNPYKEGTEEHGKTLKVHGKENENNKLAAKGINDCFEVLNEMVKTANTGMMKLQSHPLCPKDMASKKILDGTVIRI